MRPMQKEKKKKHDCFPSHTFRCLIIQKHSRTPNYCLPCPHLLPFLQFFCSRLPLHLSLPLFAVAVYSICISVAEEMFLWWQWLSPWSILVWHHNTTLRSERRAQCLLMGRSPPTGSSTARTLPCFHLILSLCLLLLFFHPFPSNMPSPFPSAIPPSLLLFLSSLFSIPLYLLS